MLNRPNCPSCGHDQAVRSLAVISPWVRELARVQERSVHLRVCSACGSAWSDRAYDEEEMSRIYGNYRGEEYTRIRAKWEPWYDGNWNTALSDESAIIASRQASILDALLLQLDPAQIRTVVDIGGDRGQFIPLGEKRYVVEVSGRELVAGVNSVAALSEIHSPDLVMSCHVLEHLADPVQELKSYLSARWVYVEVPAGIPQVTRPRRAITLGSLPMSVSPSMWRRAAAPATGRRSSELAPLRISEHVNFFSPNGLTQLLTRAGFGEPRVSESRVLAPDGSKVEVLQAIASPRD